MNNQLLKRALAALLLLIFTAQASYCEDSLPLFSNKLAPKSLFQKAFAKENSEEFRNSILSDVGIITVAFSIAFHYLEPRPEYSHLKDQRLGTILRNEFRNNRGLMRALYAVDLGNVRYDQASGIVHIPFRRKYKNYEIRICSRKRFESSFMPKSHWAVSPRFGIQAVEIKVPHEGEIIGGFRSAIRELVDSNADILWITDMEGTAIETRSSVTQEMTKELFRVLEHEPLGILTGTDFPSGNNMMFSRLVERAQAKDMEQKLLWLPVSTTNGSELYQYDLKEHKFVLRFYIDLENVLGKDYAAAIDIIKSCIEKEGGVRNMLTDVAGWQDFKGNPIDEKGPQITLLCLGFDSTRDERMHFQWEGSNELRIPHMDFLNEQFDKKGIPLEAGINGMSAIDITLRGINKGFGVMLIRAFLEAMRKTNDANGLQVLFRDILNSHIAASSLPFEAYITDKGYVSIRLQKEKRQEAAPAQVLHTPATVIFSGDAFYPKENDSTAIPASDIVINVGREINRTLSKTYFALPGQGPVGFDKFLSAYIDVKYGGGDETVNSGRAGGEPLIGHGFTVEDVEKAEIIPWTESKAFADTVAELEKIIREKAPAEIRGWLLQTLEDFKQGKGDRVMGLTKSCYKDAAHYYLGFGTARRIGIPFEFFDETNPLSDYRLEALFHELYHAYRDRRLAKDDDIESDVLTHVDAMRDAARIFWKLKDDIETRFVMRLDQEELDSYQDNRFGEAIRGWKSAHSRIPEKMAEDNWKTLYADLCEALTGVTRNPHKLYKFLEEYERMVQAKDNLRYPVESRYPILRAASLLKSNNKKKLIKALEGAPDAIRNLVVVDSILLMLNGDITEKWLKTHASRLEGRRVWQIAAEIWNAGGGLGRVMQFHGVAMKEFLDKAGVGLCHVEPYYYQGKNRKTGELERFDYSAILGIKDDTPPENKIQEVARFNIQVGEDNALAICYRAVNEAGIETYLIKGFKNGQRETDIPYYTDIMYRYRDKDNPGLDVVKREEFSYFLSLASLELVKCIEGRVKHNDKNWKAPVMHFNDGQLGLAPYLKRSKYDNDTILKDSLVSFTTHTFPNRIFFEQKLGEESVLRQFGISHEDEMKYFHHRMDIPEEKEEEKGIKKYIRRYVPVIDFTSAGVRCADWVGGVSAEHVYRLYKYEYDNWGDWAGLEMFAVTNGDLRKTSAVRFREIMQEVCGRDKKFDINMPSTTQVYNTKRRAKIIFNETYGTDLDAGLPLLEYSGRCVNEKAGRRRALSDYNIREFVKMGIQVVIGANVQADRQILKELTDLEAEIKNNKAQNPLQWPGAFILLRNIGIEDQRLILAASDMQVQDSDPVTEAAGYSESDIGACAGLQIAPPWKEGILQAQGIPLNLEISGEGNYIRPAMKIKEEDYEKFKWPLYDAEMNKAVGDAYLDAIRKLFDFDASMLGSAKMKEHMKERLLEVAPYQATAIWLSRVLEARLTAAEYLRQWSGAIDKKERLSTQGVSQAGETRLATAGTVKNGLEAIRNIPECAATGVTTGRFYDERKKDHPQLDKRTFRRELESLQRARVIESRNKKNGYKIRLRKNLRDLSQRSRDAAIEDILAIEDLDRYEIRNTKKDKKQVARVRSEVKAVIGMYTIHDINMDLYPPVDDKTTLYHVIPLQLVPFPIRDKFASVVYQLNSEHPELREKIRVVTDETMLGVIANDLATNPKNIVMAAVSNEIFLRDLPPRVKALVFKGQGNPECVIAELRALYRNDVDRLITLSELASGKKFTGSPEDIEYIKKNLDNPQALAQKFWVTLKPIAIETQEMRDRLDSRPRLFKLIQEAA